MQTNPLPGHSSSPSQPNVPVQVVDEKQETHVTREYVLQRSGHHPTAVRSGPDATPYSPCLRPDAPATLPAVTDAMLGAKGEGTRVDPLSILVRQKAEWEERSRILFENAATPLVIVNEEGTRVLEANAAATRLLGYPHEGLTTCGTVPFLEGGRIDHGVNGETKSVCRETILRSKCGEMLEVEVTATRIAGPDHARVLLSLRDLTPEKLMHRHLQQVEKMTTMGRMASGIAHEIRNPLAAVMLNLQLLDLASEQQPGTRQSIHAALEGVNRIEQVVQTTLHLARSTPARSERERLHGLIDRALWFLRVPLDQRGVRIQREYGTVDPAVLVEAKQIQQVLLNLLQNALEASPDGAAIAIRTSSAVIGSGGEVALVDIIDSGPGIPPEVLQHLFEPFRTTKAGGTGLGMTISRQIMAQHGGSITIPFTGPGGTTVRLEFPIPHLSSGDAHA